MALGPTSREYLKKKKKKKKKGDLEIYMLNLWSTKPPKIGPIRLLISGYPYLIVTQISNLHKRQSEINP